MHVNKSVYTKRNTTVWLVYIKYLHYKICNIFLIISHITCYHVKFFIEIFERSQIFRIFDKDVALYDLYLLI